MDSLTPQHVQKTLDTFNLGIQIRFFENSTATSQLAADEIGCELGQIAKSICFIGGCDLFVRNDLVNRFNRIANNVLDNSEYKKIIEQSVWC